MSISVRTWLRSVQLVLAATIICGDVGTTFAQRFVPGSGKKWEGIGDDFEDEDWQFVLNLPKSSKNIDHVVRAPSGYSTNDRLLESTYRGTPDLVERVPTPPGGLEGSKGALRLGTLHSGIPGHISYKMQQDDLIVNVQNRIGGFIQPSRHPSVVVRVWLPPFDEWEERTGSHFGFRAECSGWGIGEVEKKVGFLFNRRTVKKQERKYENYWPGFFIQFNRKEDTRAKEDSAVLIVRCDERGQDFIGPQVKPGWITLGMSFSTDGRVHYYAHEGVGDLRPQDHISSNYPYSSKADRFNTFFFNVVNQDNGRSWSTKFIVDDPTLYVNR